MGLSEDDKKRIQEEEEYRLQAEKMARRKRFWKKPTLMDTITTIVAMVILFSIANSCEKSSNDTENNSDNCWNDTVGARHFAHKFVQERLTSPSTAKFETWVLSSDVAKSIGNCRYRVSEHVDSQNALGAMIRTKFIAVVRYEGDDQWSLESLDFER